MSKKEKKTLRSELYTELKRDSNGDKLSEVISNDMDRIYEYLKKEPKDKHLGMQVTTSFGDVVLEAVDITGINGNMAHKVGLHWLIEKANKMKNSKK